jgi:glyoxylase-like metal-dependent hydrolase (beta-lactamase superfamily II)
MAEPVVEQLGSGVWSIPVPIPDSPLGHTLVYLLDADAGPVLVDAGWDDPVSLAALERGLVDAGTKLADVVGVLITHHHPDHHGLAGRVREASGCWVAMHHADAAVVRHHRAVLDEPVEPRRDRLSEALHAAGAPAEEIDTLVAHESAADRELPAVPDRELDDGEVIDLGSRHVVALWTPGHSPGHTCFWLDDAHELLAGDHLLPTITPHIGVYGDESDAADPLGAFLCSLERIERLGPTMVLPAHQYRFTNVRGRITELRDHHRDRLDELLRMLAGGDPVSLWDLASGMTWNRPWDEIPPMMRRVAMSEARAHVRHLVHRGQVERVPAEGTVYRLSSADEKRR